MLNTALHPSLQAIVDASALDPKLLAIGLPVTEPGIPARPRESLFLVAGEAVAAWNVPSLRALFRGNRIPPEMTDYPTEYVPVFYHLERHVLLHARMGRVPTDAELEEVFANLRRRPDGRSLGPTHDALWQASALTLGRFPLSEAEFGAVVGRLSKSAKVRKQGATSREYVGYLQRTFK